MDPEVIAVLAAYPDQFQGAAIQSIGNAGGFSGARFWRLRTDQGNFCLRRWPAEHPDSARLRMIHVTLQHVWSHGFNKVPVPIAANDGKTFVTHNRHYWELARWLPGAADYHDRPNRGRLQSAMQSIADFHLAAATVPSWETRLSRSSGIAMRLGQLRQLVVEDCGRIARNVGRRGWPEFDRRAHRIIELFRFCANDVQVRLSQVASLQVPFQLCIRDIWHDHVLFQGDTVSGLIDFGAINVECVAADIARLLGSLLGDDRDAWQRAVACYQVRRPLTGEERLLINAFDESGVLLSPMNWLQWVYLDGRQFERREEIIKRIDSSIRRLEQLAKGVIVG